MHGPFWNNPRVGVTGEQQKAREDRMVGLFPDGSRLVRDPAMLNTEIDQTHPFTD